MTTRGYRRVVYLFPDHFSSNANYSNLAGWGKAKKNEAEEKEEDEKNEKGKERNSHPLSLHQLIMKRYHLTKTSNSKLRGGVPLLL